MSQFLLAGRRFGFDWRDETAVFFIVCFFYRLGRMHLQDMILGAEMGVALSQRRHNQSLSIRIRVGAATARNHRGILAF
jgi:hypothetical protein